MVDLSASVSLEASLGRISAQMDRQAAVMQRIQQALDHVPQDYPIRGSGKTNTKGVAVFSCRGPNTGRQWQVNQLVVGGVATAKPTKGRVLFYAAASQPIVTATGKNPPITGLKDTTKTVWPAPAFYSTHQFILQPRDDLWIMVVTATHTVAVEASGTAEDYDIAAYKVGFTL